MNEPINGLYEDNGNKINADLLHAPGLILTLPGLATLEGLSTLIKILKNDNRHTL